MFAFDLSELNVVSRVHGPGLLGDVSDRSLTILTKLRILYQVGHPVCLQEE